VGQFKQQQFVNFYILKIEKHLKAVVKNDKLYDLVSLFVMKLMNENDMPFKWRPL
jgi:hypothetical protein